MSPSNFALLLITAAVQYKSLPGPRLEEWRGTDRSRPACSPPRGGSPGGRQTAAPAAVLPCQKNRTLAFKMRKLIYDEFLKRFFRSLYINNILLCL